jgi:hypothetical protein
MVSKATLFPKEGVLFATAHDEFNRPSFRVDGLPLSPNEEEYKHFFKLVRGGVDNSRDRANLTHLPNDI